MRTRNRGSISAFAVCVMMSLVALTALAFDGGRMVSAYAELSDIAENAARIGCQQVVGIRSGEPKLDSRDATSRMSEYLSSKSLASNIRVGEGSAEVTVQRAIPMRLLSLIGISSRTIAVTRSARVVQG